MKRLLRLGLIVAIALAVTACSKSSDSKTTTQRPLTSDSAASQPSNLPAPVDVSQDTPSASGASPYQPVEGPYQAAENPPPYSAPDLPGTSEPFSTTPPATDPSSPAPLEPVTDFAPGPTLSPELSTQPNPEPTGSGGSFPAAENPTYAPTAEAPAIDPSIPQLAAPDETITDPALINPLRTLKRSRYGTSGTVIELTPQAVVQDAPSAIESADPLAEAPRMAQLNPLRIGRSMEPRSFAGESIPQLPGSSSPDASIPESSGDSVPEGTFPSPADGSPEDQPAADPQLIEPPSTTPPPAGLAIAPEAAMAPQTLTAPAMPLPPPAPVPLPAGAAPRASAMMSEPELMEPGSEDIEPGSPLDLPPASAPVETVRVSPNGSAAAAPQSMTASITPLKAPAVAPKKEDDKPYDTVKVFYGTDRAPVVPPVITFVDHLRRFQTAIGALVLMLLTALIASLTKRTSIWSISIGSGVVAGALAIVAGYQSYNATVAARDTMLRYSTDRSKHGGLQLGICEVTIPKTHKRGELEGPTILKLEVREDLSKHIILKKTERLGDAVFYDQLKAQVDASPNKELFVFVHGFNVSFEDAARRTAQMAKDIDYQGAPVFYSWPAHDMFILTYPADENNVAWTTPHLKRFLIDIANYTEAKSINLIAHSMGSRALSQSLKEIATQYQADGRLFNQVILAAPDIDADDFKYNIAPAMKEAANRVTLYASNKDQALAVSQLVHRYPRAGDAGSDLVVVDGIDTIDVSAIDRSPWGHAYYGSSDPLLDDLKMLFASGLSPLDRKRIFTAELSGKKYYRLGAEASSTATSGMPLSR